jgi:uncharacterized membrane protein HdeD (DUF308 family)
METLSPVLSFEPFLGNALLGWVASVFFLLLSGIFFLGSNYKTSSKWKKMLNGFLGGFFGHFIINK